MCLKIPTQQLTQYSTKCINTYSENVRFSLPKQQILSVNVKRLDITKEDLMTIAKDNNIKKGEHIIKEINTTIKSWPNYADEAGLRQDLKTFIHQNLNTF